MSHPKAPALSSTQARIMERLHAGDTLTHDQDADQYHLEPHDGKPALAHKRAVANLERRDLIRRVGPMLSGPFRVTPAGWDALAAHRERVEVTRAKIRAANERARERTAAAVSQPAPLVSLKPEYQPPPEPLEAAMMDALKSLTQVMEERAKGPGVEWRREAIATAIMAGMAGRVPGQARVRQVDAALMAENAIILAEAVLEALEWADDQNGNEVNLDALAQARAMNGTGHD